MFKFEDFEQNIQLGPMKTVLLLDKYYWNEGLLKKLLLAFRFLVYSFKGFRSFNTVNIGSVD